MNKIILMLCLLLTFTSVFGSIGVVYQEEYDSADITSGGGITNILYNNDSNWATKSDAGQLVTGQGWYYYNYTLPTLDFNETISDIQHQYKRGITSTTETDNGTLPLVCYYNSTSGAFYDEAIMYQFQRGYSTDGNMGYCKNMTSGSWVNIWGGYCGTGCDDFYEEGMFFNITYLESYFEITAIDFDNSSSLADFSAFINNTLYNDSGTGTITTDLKKSDRNEFNVTIIKDGYFNKTYYSQNTSFDLATAIKSEKVLYVELICGASTSLTADLNYTFFNWNTSAVIDNVTNVPVTLNATTYWTDLSYATDYYWSCNITDTETGTVYTQSVSKFTTKDSTPPTYPVQQAPANGATWQELSLTLICLATDIESAAINYTFFNWDTSAVIGTDDDVVSGVNASTIWSGLSYNTVYNWGCNVTDDAGKTNTSATLFAFTTRKNYTETFMWTGYTEADISFGINWSANASFDFDTNAFYSFNNSAFYYNFSSNGTSALTQDSEGGVWNISTVGDDLDVIFSTDFSSATHYMYIDDDCTRAGATKFSSADSFSFSVLDGANKQVCLWMDYINATTEVASVTYTQVYS